MKDLRIIARVYNNQLRERRETLGLTQKALSERAGICCSDYARLEAMSASPVTSAIGPFGKPRVPTWTKPARSIASFYGLPPEDLFPDAVKLVTRTKAEIRVNAEEMAAMLCPPAETDPQKLLASAEDNAALEKSLGLLSSGERLVIECRWGLRDGVEMTLADIAERMCLSRGRVHQIESKALWKLRNSEPLREIKDGA